jgi:hypothetical protein
MNQDFAANTIASLSLIKQAADNLGYKSELVGEYLDILKVFKPTLPSPIQFWRNRHPFNHSLSELGSDKFLQYQIIQSELESAPINTDISAFSLPETLFFPNKNYTQIEISAITNEVIANLHFPLILKKNNSSFGRNVHLVQNESELTSLIQTYFTNSQDRFFLLFQEFIAGTEYRVVTNKTVPQIVYAKKPRFQANPTSQLAEADLKTLFASPVKTLYTATNLTFSGCDFILTPDQKVYLLEQNYFPCCHSYLKSHSSDAFIQLYQELLEEYQN